MLPAKRDYLLERLNECTRILEHTAKWKVRQGVTIVEVVVELNSIKELLATE